MPIKAWHKILETNDLKHLFKEGKGRVTQKVHDLWIELQQQYYDEFGIDIEFRVRMKKMLKLAKLNLKWIVTGDRKLLNEMTQIELEMETWGSEQSVKFYDLVDRLEVARKTPINIETVTVIQWYWMINNVTKRAHASK